MMLRLPQAIAATAARVSRSSALRLCADQARRYVAAAAVHQSGTVAGILESATQAQPLKDAVKFYEEDGEPTIWSYRDLEANVSALSSGLQTLGYGTGDKIAAWLPNGSAEYAVLVLAAANVGVTVVSVAPPVDPLNAEVGPLADLVLKHGARMLLFSHSFGVAGAPADDGAVAATHPVLNAVAPGVSAADAAGLAGMAPLSGKPFVCDDLPSLQHVVHTGEKNIRGAITFKSLLSYNGAFQRVAASAEPMVLSAENGNGISGGDAITEAVALGNKMELTADHASKNGKIVIAPSPAPSTAAAMIAAVMHESLWISPGSKDKLESVAESENASIIQ